MPKMLNGIEVPTKGRIVWVRSSAFGPEYPAIVIDGVDLAPCLFVFVKAEGKSDSALSVAHESLNPSPGTWRCRWPPREEQPDAVATAPAEETPEAFKAVIVTLRADIDDFIVEQEKLTAERDSLKNQLAANNADHAERIIAETRRAEALVTEHAKLQARLVVRAEAHNAETCKRLQLEEANQRLCELLAETKQQLTANDTHLNAMLRSETRRASALVEECNALRARLAEVERERDEARRVAKRLARTGLYGCSTDAERDAFDAAVLTALAYEVEP